MPLKLDLMSVDDIPEFADVDDRAMANYGFAQAMAAASPSDQSRKEICEYWTRQSFANDKDVTWLKVTDTETNKLIAAASWRVPLEGIEAPEVATSAEKADDEPLLTSWGLVSEESKDGEEKPNFFAVVLKMRNEFVDEYMCGRPYAWLHLLVCDPEHQRRGAGSMLVAWGCKRADERGVPSGLTASEAGLGTYLKNGFKVVKEVELDLRPYGVEGTETRRHMLRRPTPKEV